jgi:hypothetical protein
MAGEKPITVNNPNFQFPCGRLWLFPPFSKRYVDTTSPENVVSAEVRFIGFYTTVLSPNGIVSPNMERICL